jgi:hypothetical protein
MAGILTGAGDSVRAMDLEQLGRDGYTVVEGVAGPEQIEPLLALAQEVSGVMLDDPSTWDPDQWRANGQAELGPLGRKIVGLDPC